MHRKIGFSSILLIGILVALIPMSASCSGIIKVEKPSPTYEETASNSPVLEGWEKAPVSKELRGWLKKNRTAVMVFVTEDGHVRVSNLEGKEIQPCGQLVGTRIEGKCSHLKEVTIKNMLQMSSIVTSGSPQCITINFMGTLVQLNPQTGRLCGE